MNKINEATRDSFGRAISDIGSDPRIVVLDADLSESTRSKKFKEKYPDRFFNCGIAEQDMIGCAAGLAACGKIPFACSFAVFLTGNGYAQIRLQAAMSKLNLKLIGSHAGLLTGEDGGTAQALDDIALMRNIPNMTIIQPSDPIEAEQAVRAAAFHIGPVYLRLTRQKVNQFHDLNYKFKLGKAEIVKEGNDVSIIASGALVHEAIECSKLLEASKISAEIINIHTISPIDKETIIMTAQKTGLVFTCEDHNIVGGLGSSVLDAIGHLNIARIVKIGVEGRMGESGKPRELYDKYGLNARRLCDRIISEYKKNNKSIL